MLRGPAGNAIGDFTGVFTGFFICELALDDKSLCDVRKVHDMVLIALIVDGVTHGFSINGQRFVVLSIGLIPAL